MPKAASLLVLLLAAASASADEVLFNDGAKAIGKAQRVGDEVVVTTPHGEMRYKAADVKSITPGRTVWDDYADKLKASDPKDAKAQLDFLVVCCWLCMLTSAVWLVAMPWLHFSWPFYGIVCILGPVLARVFYLLSLENYIVMADLVKSAVDLFRFDLLKSLHMPQPNNIREERALWAALSEID